MNDGTGQADDAADAGLLAGERLAEARRLRKITLPDIARELHLDEPKVQALEENRFDVLGAPVFAKGHLRKYAEIVGVSVDAVMSDYGELTSAEIAPPVVGEPRKRPRDFNLGPWLLAVPLILLVFAAVYWWLGRTPAAGPAPPPASPTSNPLPSPAEPAPTELRQDSSEPVTDAEPVVAEAAPVSGLAETVPVADNAAPAETAGIELRLDYSGDCWTEVTDAAGERLYFDLGRSGRTVTLSGTPPLRVLLGDSTNVRLTVNGELFPLESAEFRGDTARLTINN